MAGPAFRQSLMAALSPADVALLEVTFARNRARFGDLRMEADGGDDQGTDAAAEESKDDSPSDDSESSDSDAEKLRREVEKYKGIARKHETRAKESHEWRKANEPKVRDHDALLESIKSEQQRRDEQVAKEAAEKARAQADSEALTKFGPRLVGAEFRTQLAGRMTSDQVTNLVDGLNVSKFLTDEGDADATAVAEYITRSIPAAPKQGSAVPPDLGAGKRQVAKPDALESGEALYATRHKRKSPAV